MTPNLVRLALQGMLQGINAQAKTDSRKTKNGQREEVAIFKPQTEASEDRHLDLELLEQTDS